LKRYALLSALLGAALISGGCTAAPVVPTPTQDMVEGSAHTMHGTLILKGNAPFTFLVLVRADGSEWELQGVDAHDRDTLQNKRVTVEGTVMRASTNALILPGFTVEKLIEAEKK
jgi:hypothetical protein